MATRQMSYDDPAYRAPVFFSQNIGAAANSTTDKFVCYTQMLLKSVTTYCTVMGTCGGTDIANGAIYAVHIQQGTGTSTYAHTTWGTTGAGNTIGTYTATTTTCTTTLAAGDSIYARKGTDATLRADIAFEMYVLPGASLTT